MLTAEQLAARKGNLTGSGGALINKGGCNGGRYRAMLAVLAGSVARDRSCMNSRSRCCARIQERVRAELARAKSEGKRLGRPPIAPALEKRIREAVATPGRPGIRVIADKLDFLSKLGGSKFVRSGPSQPETSLTRSRLAFSLPISNQAHVWQSSSAATEGLSL